MDRVDLVVVGRREEGADLTNQKQTEKKNCSCSFHKRTKVQLISNFCPVHTSVEISVPVDGKGMINGWINELNLATAQ